MSEHLTFRDKLRGTGREVWERHEQRRAIRESPGYSIARIWAADQAKGAFSVVLLARVAWEANRIRAIQDQAERHRREVEYARTPDYLVRYR